LFQDKIITLFIYRREIFFSKTIFHLFYVKCIKKNMEYLKIINYAILKNNKT